MLIFSFFQFNIRPQESENFPDTSGGDSYHNAAAMIAQLKYGTGMPFYRLENLEQNLGIPLPASTQWEIV